MSTDHADTINPTDIHGYTRRASGLIVPTHAARRREVWTKDETKLLRRMFKIMDAHGVRVILECAEPACREKPAITQQPDGSMACGCKARAFL